MDFATIIGFIGGLVIVGLAIVLGGSPFLFFNIPAVLIVAGGALFVVTMKFSLGKMKTAFAVAMKAFIFKVDDPLDLIAEVIGLSRVIRKDGPLALTNVKVRNGFLARGIDMLVDATDPEICQSILMREKLQTAVRHENGRKIFRALSDVAPAMGMIGTLIGLVQMLSHMSDPKLVGPAMAIALLTTLYGAILAHMVAKPIADKLELRAEEEQLLQSIVCDAVVGMAKGQAPYVLEHALMSYLPTNARQERPVAHNSQVVA